MVDRSYNTCLAPASLQREPPNDFDMRQPGLPDRAATLHHRTPQGQEWRQDLFQQTEGYYYGAGAATGRPEVSGYARFHRPDAFGSQPEASGYTRARQPESAAELGGRPHYGAGVMQSSYYSYGAQEFFTRHPSDWRSASWERAEAAGLRGNRLGVPSPPPAGHPLPPGPSRLQPPTSERPATVGLAPPSFPGESYPSPFLRGSADSRCYPDSAVSRFLGPPSTVRETLHLSRSVSYVPHPRSAPNSKGYQQDNTFTTGPRVWPTECREDQGQERAIPSLMPAERYRRAHRPHPRSACAPALPLNPNLVPVPTDVRSLAPTVASSACSGEQTSQPSVKAKRKRVRVKRTGTTTTTTTTKGAASTTFSSSAWLAELAASVQARDGGGGSRGDGGGDGGNRGDDGGGGANSKRSKLAQADTLVTTREDVRDGRPCDSVGGSSVVPGSKTLVDPGGHRTGQARTAGSDPAASAGRRPGSVLSTPARPSPDGSFSGAPAPASSPLLSAMLTNDADKQKSMTSDVEAAGVRTTAASCTACSSGRSASAGSMQCVLRMCPAHGTVDEETGRVDSAALQRDVDVMKRCYQNLGYCDTGRDSLSPSSENLGQAGGDATAATVLPQASPSRGRQARSASVNNTNSPRARGNRSAQSVADLVGVLAAEQRHPFSPGDCTVLPRLSDPDVSNPPSLSKPSKSTSRSSSRQEHRKSPTSRSGSGLPASVSSRPSQSSEALSESSSSRRPWYVPHDDRHERHRESPYALENFGPDTFQGDKPTDPDGAGGLESSVGLGADTFNSSYPGCDLIQQSAKEEVRSGDFDRSVSPALISPPLSASGAEERPSSGCQNERGQLVRETTDASGKRKPSDSSDNCQKTCKRRPSDSFTTCSDESSKCPSKGSTYDDLGESRKRKSSGSSNTRTSESIRRKSGDSASKDTGGSKKQRSSDSSSHCISDDNKRKSLVSSNNVAGESRKQRLGDSSDHSSRESSKWISDSSVCNSTCESRYKRRSNDFTSTSESSLRRSDSSFGKCTAEPGSQRPRDWNKCTSESSHRKSGDSSSNSVSETRRQRNNLNERSKSKKSGGFLSNCSSESASPDSSSNGTDELRKRKRSGSSSDSTESGKQTVCASAKHSTNDSRQTTSVGSKEPGLKDKRKSNDIHAPVWCKKQAPYSSKHNDTPADGTGKQNDAWKPPTHEQDRAARGVQSLFAALATGGELDVREGSNLSHEKKRLLDDHDKNCSLTHRTDRSKRAQRDRDRECPSLTGAARKYRSAGDSTEKLESTTDSTKKRMSSGGTKAGEGHATAHRHRSERGSEGKRQPSQSPPPQVSRKQTPEFPKQRCNKPDESSTKSHPSPSHEPSSQNHTDSVPRWPPEPTGRCAAEVGDSARTRVYTFRKETDVHPTTEEGRGGPTNGSSSRSRDQPVCKPAAVVLEKLAGHPLLEGNSRTGDAQPTAGRRSLEKRSSDGSDAEPAAGSPASGAAKLADHFFCFCTKCDTVFMNKAVHDHHSCVRWLDSSGSEDEREKEPASQTTADGRESGCGEDDAADDNQTEDDDDDARQHSGRHRRSSDDDYIVSEMSSSDWEKESDSDSDWEGYGARHRNTRQRLKPQRKPARLRSHGTPTADPQAGDASKTEGKRAKDKSRMFNCSRCSQAFSSRGGLLFHWQHVHKKITRR